MKQILVLMALILAYSLIEVEAASGTIKYIDVISTRKDAQNIYISPTAEVVLKDYSNFLFGTSGTVSGKEISGTVNQVITTDSGPSLTISLPQNIDINASVEFSSGTYNHISSDIVSGSTASFVSGTYSHVTSVEVSSSLFRVGPVTFEASSTAANTNYTFPSDGTISQSLRTDGNGNLYWDTPAAGGGGGGGGFPTCIIRQELAASTNNGINTANTFETTPFNTEDNNADCSFISFSDVNDQFTISTDGDYQFDCSAPMFNCGKHVSKLRDTTNSNDVLIGTAEDSTAGNGDTTRSFISGVAPVSGTTVYEIQQRCDGASSQGFGSASGNGVTEVYAICKIKQL